MTNSERRTEALAQLRPYVERAAAFSGWDFSALGVRHDEPAQPWDYDALVRIYAQGARRVLDMGTGGGERLARLRPDLPEQVVATEEWHVNVPVAHARLAPLGVDLVWCRSLQLPFRDGVFDLILNRHDEFEPAEVARVLRPGGWLLTQQIGDNHWRELRSYFPRMRRPEGYHDPYEPALAAAGLLIASQATHDHHVAYPSLGEMVFMLCVTPWTIPEFEIDRDLDALLALEDDQLSDRGLIMTESYSLLIARKPG